MKRGCIRDLLSEVTQIGAGDALSGIICCNTIALPRCTLTETIHYLNVKQDSKRPCHFVKALNIKQQLHLRC